MKILGKNLKAGEIRIETTNNEDLWYLSHIISPGDEIKGSTERKIKIGSEENAKVVRKPVTLKIKTEKTDYQPETLRILGTIIEGPDDMPLGAHQSINVQVRNNIQIKKTKWYKHDLEKLDEAQKEQTNILLVAFDREEARFAQLKKSGYEQLGEIKGDVQKKADNETKKENFYKQIAKQLEEYDQRLNAQQIIIASPAFWKEYLLNELKDETKKKSITATISGVDNNSFSELLKREETQKALENERTNKELKAIEEIMTAISKDKAFYGEKEAKEKVNIGAAKTIAVSENLLKKKQEHQKYREIDELLQAAEATNTDIMIISGKEPLQKLDSLGGIAGTLRW